MSSPTDFPSSSSGATLVLFGAGGHGRVVADAALRSGAFARVVASDGDPARCVGELLPGVALVPEVQATRLLAEGAHWHVSIGHNAARQREHGRLARHARHLASTLVHPLASVAAGAVLGAGSFIAAFAVLGPMARVGQGVIVNHGAVVDHDVQVGDFTHVAPRVALGGGVRIGSQVLLGSGAVVLPGLSVCDDVVVGAQALVCRTIAEAGVWVGVPARRRVSKP